MSNALEDAPTPSGHARDAARGSAATGAAEEGPGPGYRLEDSAGHLLRRAHQRHAALFLEHAGPVGLTATQFATLLRLEELGRASQNALGRAVALDSATIQGVVQRLAARGLVCASRDRMDRRVVVLEATAEGRSLLAEARAAAAHTNEALLAPLPEADQVQLVALLRRLLD